MGILSRFFLTTSDVVAVDPAIELDKAEAPRKLRTGRLQRQIVAAIAKGGGIYKGASLKSVVQIVSEQQNVPAKRVVASLYTLVPEYATVLGDGVCLTETGRSRFDAELTMKAAPVVVKPAEAPGECALPNGSKILFVELTGKVSFRERPDSNGDIWAWEDNRNFWSCGVIAGGTSFGIRNLDRTLFPAQQNRFSGIPRDPAVLAAISERVKKFEGATVVLGPKSTAFLLDRCGSGA